MRSLTVQDLEHAFRSLVRVPVFTVTSVLTLALAADANAAIALRTNRFGGDASIIGRSVQIDGSPVEVMAVMPRGFGVFGLRADAYTPFA